MPGRKANKWPVLFVSRFLFDPDCALYKRYRSKVESLRKGVIAESTSRKEDADTSKKSKRKSRWGDETDKVVLVPPPGILPTAAGRNPQLVQYAIKVFGSTDLEEAQWKQCEDQLKVHLTYVLWLLSILQWWQTSLHLDCSIWDRDEDNQVAIYLLWCSFIFVL